MSPLHSVTVGSEGEVTLPLPVREWLDVEAGDVVLFRLDADDGVRLVGAPADPMERLERVRERAADLEVDAQELLDRERADW